MSVDLAVWASAAGAAGAALSAGIALWKNAEMKSAVTKEIDEILRRSIEAARPQPDFDVFLSYSAADSKEFARQLADALQARSVSVWLDEDQIQVGDNAITKLGEGLGSSRYGLVILSPEFFGRDWSAQELKALLRRETEGQSMILPVWHGVSQDEVQRYAPDLALKRALKADDETVEEIASDVVARIVGEKG